MGTDLHPRRARGLHPPQIFRRLFLDGLLLLRRLRCGILLHGLVARRVQRVPKVVVVARLGGGLGGRSLTGLGLDSRRRRRLGAALRGLGIAVAVVVQIASWASGMRCFSASLPSAILIAGVTP